MRISDWSSDVCSSDLGQGAGLDARNKRLLADRQKAVVAEQQRQVDALTIRAPFNGQVGQVHVPQGTSVVANGPVLSVVDLDKFAVEIKVPESLARDLGIRSAEHTSELQSLMRTSYAVFCLKKNK